jgi:hypothetical protein
MHTICSLFFLGGQREGGGSPIPPYPFWSAWRAFSTWERLFLVALRWPQCLRSFLCCDHRVTGPKDQSIDPQRNHG